ncbi:hypothetical protein AFLA_007510 [Aspergillus flavus NRRL3357]|nr:hypothetical protein AFLA_007510 [Aspergillus flavus NRRL3357]
MAEHRIVIANHTSHFIPLCETVQNSAESSVRPPAMACSPDIYIGRSVCVLCKQTATVGSYILDLAQNLLTIPECGDPCGPCLRSPYPSVWFHAACYNVLKSSYVPSKKPTFEDLGSFSQSLFA